MTETETSDLSERRGLLKKMAAVVVGGVVSLVAPLSGLFVFLHPLRKKAKKDDQLIRVTSLDSVPADSVPRRFSVLADRVDAWNKFPNVPVGAVFLRRTSETDVEAFNVVCPHLGCAIDHRGESYFCPCHNSTFALDGEINDPNSPSPRGMDALKVEVRDGDIWVMFQNFRTGTEQPIPIS